MFTVRDFREDMDEQLDEEVHRVRSERVLEVELPCPAPWNQGVSSC